MAGKYRLPVSEAPVFFHLGLVACEICDTESGEVTHARGPGSDLCNLCTGCVEHLRRMGSVVWYVDER